MSQTATTEMPHPPRAVRHRGHVAATDAAPRRRRPARSEADLPPLLPPSARLHRPSLSRLRRAGGRGPRLRLHAAASARSRRTYDLDGLRDRLTRGVLDAREPTIWRYAELLPVSTLPERRPARRPVAARRRRRGSPHAWGSTRSGSRTTRATRRCRSRTASSASPRLAPPSSGFHTLACASTGNLSAAVAAAAAARGLRAVVFIPADLEPAKVAQARALGATVVRVDGSLRRRQPALPGADRRAGGLGRSSTSTCAPTTPRAPRPSPSRSPSSCGWRTPDVVVAPLASGSMYTKLGRGLRRARRGRAARRRADPLRGWPGCGLRRPSPTRSRPARTSSGRSSGPTRSCARWPSARPPTAATRIKLARETRRRHPRRARRRDGRPPSGSSPRPRASSPRPPAA